MSHESAILALLSSADAGVAPDRVIPEARAIADSDGLVTGWLYPDSDVPGAWLSYDLSAFRTTGAIGEAVIATFASSHPATQAKLTVFNAHRRLTTGLLPFLQNPELARTQTGAVDRALLNAFKADLDERFAHTKTFTRGQTFSVCQAILRDSGIFPDVDWIDVPYRNAHLDIEHVEPVDLDDMMTILDAAIADVEVTIAREDALADPSHALWSSKPDVQLLQDALLLRTLHPAGPPPRQDLLKSEDMRVRRIVWHRYAKVVTVAYPTVERLTPFAILLLFLFRLNSSDAQRLRQDSVRWLRVLGVERVAVVYFKRRSGEVLSPTYPVDEGAGNPARLIRFLEEWTMPLRDDAPERLAGRMMIAQAIKTTKKGERIIGFESKTSENRIGSYCAALGVEDVTATRIRKSALRLIDTLTGGDPLVRMAAGGHRSRQTSERHYPGDPDQQDEAMAHGFAIAHGYMLGHQRDHPKSRTPDEDQLCITPGWDCSNPYLGVAPGERPKHKCRAYGRCPACPLGRPDLASPLSYARSKALLTQIQNAEHTMHRPYWIGSWRPVEVRLRTHWLPKFNDDARARGELIDAPMMEVRDERHG